MKHIIKMRGCAQRDGYIIEYAERPFAPWLWCLRFGNQRKFVILMFGDIVCPGNVYALHEGGGVT